jgi:hypothetical protein
VKPAAHHIGYADFVTKLVISPQNTGARVALVLPCVALAVSGAGLFVASLTSSGVANHVGYGEWVPPAGGLIMAVPLIGAGVVYGLLVWRRTASAFRLNLIRLLPALILLLASAALGVAYIATIDNPETYEGSYNALTDTFQPNLTLEAFYYLSVGLSVFLLSAIYLAMRFLYLAGIEHPGLSKPEGVDAIGTLMSERRVQR